MSKISEQAAEAFLEMRPFKLSNTEVRVAENDEKTYAVEMYLYGNRIAYMDSDMRPQIDLKTLAAWPTNVTIHRLRALWFDVRRRNGKTLVDGEEIQI